MPIKHILLKYGVVAALLFSAFFQNDGISIEQNKSTEYSVNKRKASKKESSSPTESPSGEVKDSKGKDDESEGDSSKVPVKRSRVEGGSLSEKVPINIEDIKLIKYSENYKYELEAKLAKVDQDDLKQYSGSNTNESLDALGLTKQIFSNLNNLYLIVDKAQSNSIAGFVIIQEQDQLPLIIDIGKIYQQFELPEKSFDSDVVGISALIFKSYRGHNLAAKSCEMIIEKLKEERVSVEVVTWMSASDNLGSIKTAQRCGLTEIDDKKIKGYRLFAKYIRNRNS